MTPITVWGRPLMVIALPMIAAVLLVATVPDVVTEQHDRLGAWLVVLCALKSRPSIGGVPSMWNRVQLTVAPR